MVLGRRTEPRAQLGFGASLEERITLAVLLVVGALACAGRRSPVSRWRVRSPTCVSRPSPYCRRKRRYLRPVAKTNRKSNGGPLGFEASLWAAADKLRGHMDAAECKHVVLGLVFLKYISDAFEVRRAILAADPQADPEDPEEGRGSQAGCRRSPGGRRGAPAPRIPRGSSRGRASWSAGATRRGRSRPSPPPRAAPAWLRDVSSGGGNRQAVLMAI